MRAIHSNQARKPPVNLTPNEDLALQAKEGVDNFSAVVELLLAWNAFDERSGSFADEYSTL